MIAIVIIGILAAALVPRLKGAQGVARNAVRIVDIDQISKALAMYASENGGNYPPGTMCIGGAQGQECRPGYIQNTILGGGDGGTGARALGDSGFDTILLQYMNSIPIDPLPNRTIGERYIYRKGAGDVHCNPSETINNGSRLARQPEKISPSTDQACSPGQYACCSGIGCGSHYFCVLQLD